MTSAPRLWESTWWNTAMDNADYDRPYVIVHNDAIAIASFWNVQGVPPLAEQHFVFVGAGQANIGSARLLSRALQDEGALHWRPAITEMPGMN